MMKIIFQRMITILFLILAMCIIPNSMTNTAYAAGVELPYSFHNEHPYSLTGFRANLEIFDIEEGDAFYLSQLRADININKNKASLYTILPFAGVTELQIGEDEENEYDFGNLSIGAKSVLLSRDLAVLTGGIEVKLPTVDDDLAAGAARSFFRDFSSFTEDTFTVKPYAVLGLGKDVFAFQANFGADIITNADEIEDDDTEVMLEYGGTASITPHLPVPFGTAIMVELLAVSSTTFDEDRTEAFLTPGFRFGGQIFSIGAGVEVPLGEETDELVENVGFMVDMVIRFGS